MGQDFRIPLLVAVIAFLTSCGSGESPTANSGYPALDGRYAGTIEDSVDGAGGVRADFLDSYGALTGTWQADGGGFRSDPYNIYGSTFDRGEVRFSVTLNRVWPNGGYFPDDGVACVYRMVGTVQGTEVAGSYDTFGCTVLHEGTFRLAREP